MMDHVGLLIKKRRGKTGKRKREDFAFRCYLFKFV